MNITSLSYDTNDVYSTGEITFWAFTGAAGESQIASFDYGAFEGAPPVSDGPANVPEPATMSLLIAGAVALRRRRS